MLARVPSRVTGGAGLGRSTGTLALLTCAIWIHSTGNVRLHTLATRTRLSYRCIGVLRILRAPPRAAQRAMYMLLSSLVPSRLRRSRLGTRRRFRFRRDAAFLK
jgi:hypothetical protein